MSEKAYRAKELVWIQNPEGQWSIAESGTLQYSRSIPFREIENAKDSAEENYKTLWQSGGVEVEKSEEQK